MNVEEYTKKYENLCLASDKIIDPALFEKYDVKRGLRNKNGKGVMAGLNKISNMESFKIENGVEIPCEGKLWYRGYNVVDLVSGFKGNHLGFEEIAYLIIFGELPTEYELSEFSKVLNVSRRLPEHFTRDVIMKAPSQDIMNSMTKSVLTLAAYDKNAADLSISNVLRQSLMLISTFPMLAVYGYHAYNHFGKNKSMYIHRPDSTLSTAENILRMLRPNREYTPLEARVLDIAMVLHMEHGGGNNSTFTTRVVTSSGSDTYSVIAAALCSLKGPKHGGANIKVVEMVKDIKKHVSDVTDREELKAYLGKILDKEAFDGRGLIYGMGHAVYSLSDPRAKVFEGFVEKLAHEKHREKDFDLYSAIAELAPEVIAEKRRIYKGVSPNVDFYSGFVYSMLEIPPELFTPIFAIARIVGWSAHRIDELINADKIIRPAYKSIMDKREYVFLENR